MVLINFNSNLILSESRLNAARIPRNEGFHGFDGLSMCLFSESFAGWLPSVKGRVLSWASAPSPPGPNWSSWMGSILWLSWDLDENPRPVDKQLYECVLRDSMPKCDRTAELNMGCIKHFLSGNSHNEIRHTGHVECCCSHMSMHVTWKKWPQ